MADLLGISEEERFRLLVSAVTDYAIYMLDASGHIATWNPGAQRFKGYVADEIIGQHFSRFFTPEDIATDLPGRALQRAAAEGRFEAEGWRVRKDGSRFWAHVVIDPIRDESGNHLGFAKITRDISDKKRAEEELDETREALAQAQKLQALGELTGGIAHDFNNLMTVVAGASDFLLKHPDLPQDKRQRYLKAIVETTDRATSLTNQLLTFGRRQSLHPVVINLDHHLDAFADMTARMLSSRIRVLVELKAANSRVEVDLAQLDTALLNAAINARDAMPNGGRFTIETSDWNHEGRQAIRISLRDTGTGISEERLARVFEPFFTTKEVGKGTGLGLSQIHGFAAQAGGTASIDSLEGKGTTLHIVLPCSSKELSKNAPATDVAALPEGLRVLLVEDNENVRGFAEVLLRDLKCNPTPANNGLEALDILGRQQFDVVFSDVVMPGMTGVQFAEAVRMMHPDMPMLLATGYSEQTILAEETGFPVLSKPYDMTSLSKSLSRVIASSTSS